MQNRFIALLIILLFLPVCGSCDSSPLGPDEVSRRAMMAVERVKEIYDSDAPGAAYLISHQGKTIVSGGIGMANMEWKPGSTNYTNSIPT